MIPYAGADYNLTFSQSRLQLFNSTPTTKGKGGAGKVSPIGWSHLYLTASFYDMKGERRGGSCLYVIGKHRLSLL